MKYRNAIIYVAIAIVSICGLSPALASKPQKVIQINQFDTDVKICSVRYVLKGSYEQMPIELTNYSENKFKAEHDADLATKVSCKTDGKSAHRFLDPCKESPIGCVYVCNVNVKETYMSVNCKNMS